jgi:hypothetical protein
MRVSDRRHIAAILALVRTSCAGGWYAIACGQAMLHCSRCGRPRKALCSPRPQVKLLCTDCFALGEHALDRANITRRVS